MLACPRQKDRGLMREPRTCDAFRMEQLAAICSASAGMSLSTVNPFTLILRRSARLTVSKCTQFKEWHNVGGNLAPKQRATNALMSRGVMHRGRHGECHAKGRKRRRPNRSETKKEGWSHMGDEDEGREEQAKMKGRGKRRR